MYLGLLGFVSLALLGFAVASLAVGGDPAPSAAACPTMREAPATRELIEGALSPYSPAREERSSGTWM